MKKILEKILAALARKIIQKYHPKIVGITGSIGKTSAKEAVYSVLSSKYKVRKNVKNYNNEIGVPLTIIGAESGGRSPWRWVKVFLKAASLLWREQKYPKVLVLEMGADKPGDIGYLTGIAPCDIGVVTKISPTHLEFFGSLEKIAREKSKIVTHLQTEGTAILNRDDVLVMKMRDKIKAKVMTFGQTGEADVSCLEVNMKGDGEQLQGLQFKINFHGSIVPMFIPGVVGKHQINAALIGVSAGIAMSMNLVEISRGLQNYHSPRGRMRLLTGMKNSTLIDDTYNSSPDAARAAVESVAELPAIPWQRKIAVLGDMLELGELTESAHYDLGKLVAQRGFKKLLAVGNYAAHLARGARENGLADVKLFTDSEAAGDYLIANIQPKDLILFKGSQGARMEKAVKKVLADQDNARKYLVRQTAEWLR